MFYSRENMVKAESMPHQISATDVPDIFTGKVLSVTEVTNKSNRPTIRVETDYKTDAKNSQGFVISYSKPKALTGSSQLDILFQQLVKLGLQADTEVMIGKTFKWSRQILPGSMKGFARHYPSEIVSPTTT